MPYACRLLALVAVLMLPFAMAAAPAQASQMHHSSAASDHCPQQPAQDDSAGWMGECLMPCSAALPAIIESRFALEPLAQGPADPIVVSSLAGILLEIATPPPKLS
jgi:hypothetical protein